jgi:hypothetical protein
LEHSGKKSFIAKLTVHEFERNRTTIISMILLQGLTNTFTEEPKKS